MPHFRSLLALLLLITGSTCAQAATVRGHVVALGDARGSLTLPDTPPASAQHVQQTRLDLTFDRWNARDGSFATIEITGAEVTVPGLSVTGTGRGTAWVEKEGQFNWLHFHSNAFTVDPLTADAESTTGELLIGIRSKAFPDSLSDWGNFSVVSYGARWNANFESDALTIDFDSVRAQRDGSPVPLPPAIGLMAGAMIAVAAVGRRQRTSSR